MGADTDAHSARKSGDATPGQTSSVLNLRPLSGKEQLAGAANSVYVLIVEDEAPIAEAVAMVVEDAGYTTMLASNGRRALELARARHPALVITDLMMPLMDGDELIAALRDDATQHGAPTPPPVILMTAAGLKRANATGADAILRKPFDLTDLEALLSRFLGPPTQTKLP